MQVTVEATSTLERRMKVEVPEETLESEISKRLNSMMGTVRVPGFRPGKVPFKIIVRRYGRAVRDEVVGEMLRSSLFDALTKEQLRPAGAPTIDPVDSEPGRGLAYTAVFEVLPEVSLASVENLKVVRPVAEINDADVERMLETLRKQRREWMDVARPASEGDRVVVDFSGHVDGAPLEHGQGKEVPVELGAKKMIQGFEEGLIGGKAGDEPTLNLRFPEDYRAEEVAGKAVTFQIKIHTVQEAVLPEIDEKFARDFGVHEGGVERLHQEIRSNLERELHEKLNERTKLRVMDALLADNPVEVPKALVRDESHKMMTQQMAELERQGIDAEKLEFDPGLFEEAASRRVSLGLLMSELIRSSDIKADPDRVRAKIETMASSYEEPNQVVNWYYGDKERMKGVEAAVLEDQIVEWLLDRANVTEEQTSFDELLNPGQTTERVS